MNLIFQLQANQNIVFHQKFIFKWLYSKFRYSINFMEPYKVVMFNECFSKTANYRIDKDVMRMVADDFR